MTAYLDAAHRDPDVYDDPDRFDVTRRLAQPQLIFGIGRHYCIGAALARMQIQEVLRAVTTRWAQPGLAPGVSLQTAVGSCDVASPPHRVSATGESMTTTDRAPRWDLETIYPALDDRSLHRRARGHLRRRRSARRALRRARHPRRRARVPTSADITALEEIVTATNAMHEELRPVNAYLHGLVTTDSRNERAAALAVELQTRTAALGPLGKRLGAWLAALGIEEFAARSDTAAAHEFALEKAADDAKFQMGEAGGVARRRARAVGRARLAAAARRRVVAARRRDRRARRHGRTGADGVRPRPRDASRRGTPAGRLRRRARGMGDGDGAARRRAQRCQGSARRAQPSS